MSLFTHRTAKVYGPVFLCVFILAATILYPHFFLKKKVPMFNIHSTEGVERARDFWESEIARVGGETAYAQLLAAYATSTPGDQHTVAHIFGGSLYSQEGESGLVVCDTSFSFGCFHEFLGRAIESQGLSGVNNLNEACFKALGPGKALSCTHGLGHGIQSYLGYDFEDLEKGLTVCTNLPHGDPIGGCPGGLFMEFNMRNMRSFSGMPLRPIVPGGILYPCSKLEEKHQALCYYWQPQWWSPIFKNDGYTPEEIFKKIGALCATLPEAFMVRCFEGAGTIVGISADYDVAKGIELCSLAAQTTSAKGSCIVSAASSYFSEQSARDRALQLCEGLREPWASRCVASATGNSPIPGAMN